MLLFFFYIFFLLFEILSTLMNLFETTSETESTTDGIFSYTVTQSALFYAAWAVSETTA